MDKSKVSLIIDALMLLAITAIAGIGFLTKWVLPPGPDRLAKYGRSIGVSWLGMDRHQFGTVHLCIGLALLGLLLIHIVLHWGQIVAIYRRLVPKTESRRAAGALFGLACVSLLAFPLFVRPEVREAGFAGGAMQEASVAAPGTQLLGSTVEAQAAPQLCEECQVKQSANAPRAGSGAGHRYGQPACAGCPGCD